MKLGDSASVFFNISLGQKMIRRKKHDYKQYAKEKLAIVAVNRDSFPMSLSERRRKAVADAYKATYGDIYECPEVLPVATRSFGGIGVFAIPEMGRFYRHVLIEKNYPHHGAVAFGHYGKTLYEVFKYLGVAVDEINFNQPKGMLYPTENPF